MTTTQMNLKKVLSVLMIVAILAVTFVAGVSAVAEDGCLYCTVTPLGGGKIEVAVNYDNNPGISGMAIQLNFNKENLTPVSIDTNGILADAVSNMEQDGIDFTNLDYVTFAYAKASLNDKTASGMLCKVVFNVKDGDWTTTDFTITYMADGGISNKNCKAVNPDTESSTYTHSVNTVTFMNGENTVYAVSKTTGTTVNAPAAPTAAEGKAFAGWKLGETTVGAGAEVTVNADATYTAAWTDLEKYTVTFNAEGCDDVSCYEGGKVTVPNYAPVKVGNVFLGWSTTENATEKEYVAGDELDLGANVTLYPVWQAKTQFTVSFSVEGCDDVTCYEGDEVTVPAYAPVKDGFDFLGWATTENATEIEYVAGDKLTPATNVTLYPVWIASAKYQITFDANTTYTVTGTIPEPIEKTMGVDVNLPATVLTINGHTFKGWATTADATVAEYAAKGATFTIDADTVLYGVWEVSTFYNMKFDPNIGTSTSVVLNMPADGVKGYDVDYVFPAEVPYRKGYTFLGWSANKSATTVTLFPKSVYNKNITRTFYAIWKASSFITITYNVNCTDATTEAPAAQQKMYCVPLKIDGTYMARPGYKFLGWSANPRSTVGTYQPGGSYVNDVSRTFYAVWEASVFYAISYDVNCNDCADTAPATQSKIHGVNLILSDKVLTRPGYTFMGWSRYYKSTAAGYVPSSYFSINANVTMYAVWKASIFYDISYDLNYEGCDNATYAPATQKKIHGQNMIITQQVPAVVRRGYVFMGWSRYYKSTAAGYVPGSYFSINASVTMYAVWAPVDSYNITYSLNYTGADESGLPTDQWKNRNVAYTVSDYTPTRDGYTFLGWARYYGAKTAEFAAGDSYTINADATLYAVWAQN